MTFMLFMALLLFPFSLSAQVLPLDSNGLTLIHPSPSTSYLYDQRGNSATIYEINPGVRWYSQENQQGRITSQGYVFEPIARPKPLRVPESMRITPQYRSK